MSDYYYFQGQFKCMYCKIDLDPEGTLGLPAGDNVDLTCQECGAVWKFFTHVQLNLKLQKGGKFNKHGSIFTYPQGHSTLQAGPVKSMI